MTNLLIIMQAMWDQLFMFQIMIFLPRISSTYCHMKNDFPPHTSTSIFLTLIASPESCLPRLRHECMAVEENLHGGDREQLLPME